MSRDESTGDETLPLGLMAPGRQAASASGPAGGLWLTLLAHPEPERVGEQASFTAGGLSLGRLEPCFAAGAGEGRPPGDPFLSRKPVRFEVLRDGGVRVSAAETTTPVTLDGRPLVGEAVVEAARLEEGVTVELAGRVALLLHRIERPLPQQPALGLVGRSAALAQVRREILQVADLEVPVLVRGETGSGKELVARALHQLGRRADRTFLAVNMATVAPTLAASELFGHERGAFSGAVRAHDGYFARAHRGTLFLDEVGDTPPDVQVMLLRALETGEILPVGATSPQRVDVRLVAATDAPLEEAVGSGRFRGPLLHRLAGFQIHVPPLRRRRDDIGLLFFHFVRQMLDEMGLGAAPGTPQAPWVPAGLVAELARFDWPGNVRQLRNVVRQLVIAGRGEPAIPWEGRLGALLGPTATPAPTASRPASEPPAARKTYRNIADVSDDEILAALEAHRWRPQPTAAALGVSRTSLYGRMSESPRLQKGSDLSEAQLKAAWDATGGNLDEMAAQLQVSRAAMKIRMKQLGWKGIPGD